MLRHSHKKKNGYGYVKKILDCHKKDYTFFFYKNLVYKNI